MNFYQDVTREEYNARPGVPSEGYDLFMHCVTGLRLVGYTVYTVNTPYLDLTLQDGTKKTVHIRSSALDTKGESFEEILQSLVDGFKTQDIKDKPIFLYDVVRFPMLDRERSYNANYVNEVTFEISPNNPELTTVLYYNYGVKVRYGVLTDEKSAY